MRATRAPPPCVPLAHPLLPAAVLILLKQKAAITNWDAFAATHNVSGWSADQPTICAWTGVICSQDRTRVSELNIECRRSAARTCTVPVEGTLIPELTRIE